MAKLVPNPVPDAGGVIPHSATEVPLPQSGGTKSKPDQKAVRGSLQDVGSKVDPLANLASSDSNDGSGIPSTEALPGGCSMAQDCAHGSTSAQEAASRYAIKCRVLALRNRVSSLKGSTLAA